MVEHIRPLDNARDDALYRLAKTKRKSQHRSVMQIWLRQPSVGEAECLAVTEAETWMTPIIWYLEHGRCMLDEEKVLRQ